MSEERFEDGNIAEVVKIGDTVRRSTGFWTPAVHALLRHLEAQGFDGAPRVLGIDEQGREILTYLPGVTAPAELDGYLSDEFLLSAASLLRRYHQAARGFAAPEGTRWNTMPGVPDGTLICHNDFAPWNTVVAGGRASAIIDWDLASPGPPEWDLAYSVWRFVPLHEEEQYGGPSLQARRLRLFCAEYGWNDIPALLDMIPRRQQVSIDALTTWAAAGIPAFVRMVAEGYHLDGVRRDQEYLRRERQSFV